MYVYVYVYVYVLLILTSIRLQAERINKDNKMPMHYAAVWNQPHVLQYLLDKPPNGAGAGKAPSIIARTHGWVQT